jgi:DNA-binding transcriptional ArsR family regulator
MADDPSVPRHELNDPREIRALAHPLRLRLMEDLAALGPATATELAERVGESPANCSWHLRLLARYGFVEEAGGGEGRRRPWRVVLRSNSWGHRDDSAELMAAGDAATGMLMEQEVAALRDWMAGRRAEPREWRDAAGSSQSIGWLTAEELAAVNDEILAIMSRHVGRITDPASRPAGARFVRMVAWAFPDRRFTSGTDATGSGEGGDA